MFVSCALWRHPQKAVQQHRPVCGGQRSERESEEKKMGDVKKKTGEKEEDEEQEMNVC